MNSSSFRRFHPFFFVSLLLLSSIAVCLSRNTTQAPHLVLQPTKPNNSYFSLRGSTFLLNCTITGETVHVINLSWWHNEEQLPNSKTVQIGNATLQLQLINARKSNNGIYWCGSKSDKKSLRMTISLSVADPPSPPRNLEWNAIGAIEREVHLYWTASSYTGGLPIDYSIKLCLNDSVINPTPSAPTCKWIDRCHVQPVHVNVISDKRRFSCVLKSDKFDFFFGTASSHSIYVVASNAVGSATSEIFLPFIELFQATPWPPERFMVKQLSDREQELKVSWKAKRGWNYMSHSDVEYTVLYSAREDKENKTAVAVNKHFTILIGLKAYADYYVYLKVRFRNHNESYGKSAYSDILGPIVIKTSPGDPVNPPVVKRHHSDIFPSNSDLRNVTVEWKLADVSSWRGAPGKYKVFCRRHRPGKGQTPSLEYITDAALNKTTLPKLNSRTKYNVYLQMCNKANKCSNIGKSYIIDEVQDKGTPTNYVKTMSSAQIATVSVLTGMGFLGVIPIVYLLRKFRLGELTGRILNLSPLRERMTLDPPAPYECLEEASVPTEEAYDEMGVK